LNRNSSLAVGDHVRRKIVTAKADTQSYGILALFDEAPVAVAVAA